MFPPIGRNEARDARHVHAPPQKGMGFGLMAGAFLCGMLSPWTCAAPRAADFACEEKIFGLFLWRADRISLSPRRESRLSAASPAAAPAPRITWACIR